MRPFLQPSGWSHAGSMTARVCLCVRTVWGALTGQCSVQCRREQRRPRPGQTQYPGNPCVFRSPGPYLMSLSKKKVALSGVFLSHCLPLALLFPSFSHASHPLLLHLPCPLEPLCEWMDSKCLLSNSARLFMFLHISPKIGRAGWTVSDPGDVRQEQKAEKFRLSGK